MTRSMSRRSFARLAAGGGIATVAAALGARSTMAMPTAPTAATDLQPTVTWYVDDLLTKIASGDRDTWTHMVAPKAQSALPEEPVDAQFMGILSMNVDFAGEINAFVVYSGLRRAGGLYYDFLHLKVVNGTFVVTEWENRLPTAAE